MIRDRPRDQYTSNHPTFKTRTFLASSGSRGDGDPPEASYMKILRGVQSG